MFQPQQAINTPFGVTVFGSAINRVPPDLVSIRGSVSALEQTPPEAFSKAKKAAHEVQDYLQRLKIAEFGVSRAALTRQLRFLVAAGMNEIERFSFQTSRLKEERRKARRMAVVTAIEKAQNYCSAASVGLGRVLHIEDVNPMTVQGQEARGFHSPPAIQEDNDGFFLDPSLIEIAGAVLMTFEIER